MPAFSIARTATAVFRSDGCHRQAPNQDDYTWINYNDCWSKLLALNPGLQKINSCYSVRDGYPDADDFGVPNPAYSAANSASSPPPPKYGVSSSDSPPVSESSNSIDTRVGWIYWGGRDDLYVNGKLAYRSPRRQGQHLTPGSQTLWTCWCWDSAGNWGPSMCPHVGANFVQYPQGVTLQPPPDGLGVALDDGSASFVPWTELVIIQQSNGWKLYYKP